MDVYTANIWKDIELRIDPDPFCTSCQISSINKKARPNNPLKPKTHSKWVFMDITTEEVMDKLDTIQAIFGKVDEFGWWD